jgi:hypothetical protein
MKEGEEEEEGGMDSKIGCTIYAAVVDSCSVLLSLQVGWLSYIADGQNIA